MKRFVVGLALLFGSGVFGGIFAPTASICRADYNDANTKRAEADSKKVSCEDEIYSASVAKQSAHEQVEGLRQLLVEIDWEIEWNNITDVAILAERDAYQATYDSLKEDEGDADVLFECAEYNQETGDSERVQGLFAFYAGLGSGYSSPNYTAALAYFNAAIYQYDLGIGTANDVEDDYMDIYYEAGNACTLAGALLAELMGGPPPG